MSDKNPDVAPQESVVDFPASHEAAAKKPSMKEQLEAGVSEEEPVSLDGPEADPEEVEAEPAEEEAADDADPDAEEAEADTEEEGDEEADEAEDEMLEFDFGGNKLEVKKGDVPPELAEKIEAFSKDIWSDYTKKSQANADTAKSLKARTEALENLETLSGEALDAFTKGKSIKAEIEQLSAIDLQSLWQSQPDRARQVSDALSAKQAELQGIIQTVDQYETQLTEARQAELERRAEEGKQVLDRKYKGFSSEIAPKLEAYAVQKGIPEADAKTWAQNPTVAEMAYKAMLYDQMQAAKTPKTQPKQANPVRSMKNKGSNRQAVNPNDMSYAELGKVLGIK